MRTRRVVARARGAAAGRRRARRSCSRPGRSGAAGRRSPRRRRCARRGARRRAARPCARPGWRRRARSGAWKVPTLSAREWRSAVLATLGANGSCTWQRSSAARSKRSEIVRATSIGSAARRAAGQRRQRLADGQHARLAGRRARARRCARPCASRARARARTTAPRRAPGARARELVGDPRDERVDVVAVLPRIGRDLGDGQRLGHRGQNSPVARALPPALGERRERRRRVGPVEELDAGALLALHGGAEQVAEAVVEHRLGARDGGARDVVEARGPGRDALVEVGGRARPR